MKMLDEITKLFAGTDDNEMINYYLAVAHC